MPPHDVRNLLREASDALGDRLEAELLLIHTLDVSRAWLFAHADDRLPDLHIENFRGLVARRVAGEPVAYIMGSRDFWSLSLEVSPATLIPRPETELLVELALERMTTDARVVDLGTGSGAIALSLAREFPQAHVLAVDFSDDALHVARRNAQRLQLGHVRFAQGSWWDAVGEETFDLAVSNPPYIASADEHLAQGDLRFEPSTALASGADGLDDIRLIVAGASAHVRPGGWLLMEHGWDQGDAVRALLDDAGFVEVFTAKDMEDRDRVSGGRVA
ncbi:release factor glutamine methyltransferase [Luteibacter sp. Sphag1AF]|uniref:peptide chain release factor N(5)-glutamine methyltransferase n=1 Tax=Luteibacter sp. Sphag1AF TaxID=2587031 RepID=UPI001616A228|nr:peptide chain release factor N(5)-glutamine methyltransferase [Luteibacter sp. Sphag1AF]MBB3227530.1 release factor glutamine methyltransferase [Luteibacter sp. Sphag1AF]